MKTHNIPSYKGKSKISLLCLMTLSYDKHSKARNTPVSNIFLAQTLFEPLKFDCTMKLHRQWIPYWPNSSYSFVPCIL